MLNPEVGLKTCCTIDKRKLLDEKFWIDQQMILYQICRVTHLTVKIMTAKILKSNDKYFVENWENLGMRLSNSLQVTVSVSNNRLQPFRSKRSSASSIPSKSNPSKTHQAMEVKVTNQRLGNAIGSFGSKRLYHTEY